MPRVVRRPTHAGSWYERDAAKLQKQIDEWMGKVDGERACADMPGRDVVPTPERPLRAVIGPHAGYSYCGHVMAHAYRFIDPARVSRIFLLGPSHHVYSRRCYLSTADEYSTPLGPLKIDRAVVDDLRATGQFDDMPLRVDEAEHSLELHTSFIASVMRGRDFTLVPIMVGALSPESEGAYGKLLAPYLDDPSNLFIVSSDFCHWGSRFNYTFVDESKGEIWQSVQWLDELGMRIIEGRDPAKFSAYLQEYRNTICGRHPIGVLLNAMANARTDMRCGFRFYDQSSHAREPEDSSVSYASALVCVA